MKYTWRTEWPHWILIGGMLLLAAITWSHVPDRLPVHWGITGGPDGYGGKFEGLLAIPLMTLAIYLLMIFVPRIDPGRANYERFVGPYSTFRLALVAFFAAMYGVMHLAFRGREVNMSIVMSFLVGALFLLIGNVLGKVRPNWFIGIRTPWTLSSKLAWTRTHRLGGWVFAIAGILMMAAGVIAAPWAFWTAIGTMVVGSLGLSVYSYFVWRKDPDKTPPAGTLPA
jgi:uncharacterized membrane protein